MLFLQDAFKAPSIPVPISVSASMLYILPPVACSFVVSVLVLMPHTRTVRVALWPIVALLALRAVSSVDMRPQGKLVHGNFISLWCGISVLEVYIPRETRPGSRTTFIFYTLLSAITHAFINDVCAQAIQSFAGPGSISNGFTIFDETLHPSLQYSRAGIMTVLLGIMTYASMQFNYDVTTVLAVLLFRQDPAQWPPVFDAPWRATSLGDFWGRRWHQWARHSFLFLGGYPLSVFFGRSGIVIGAFLASAVTHDIFLVAMDSKAQAWRMFAAFGMMAPGTLAERAFYGLTGRRVRGLAGWFWTMTWLLLWQSLMIDGFARVGGIGHSGPLASVMPLQTFVQQKVMEFDGWLHAI